MIQPLENHPIHTPSKPVTDQLRGVEKIDKDHARDYSFEHDLGIDPDKKREHRHGLGQDTFEKTDGQDSQSSDYSKPGQTETKNSETSSNDSNLDITI